MRFGQCLLRKTLPDRMLREQISWLPEKFCKVGKVLKVQNDDGSWEDGYKVETVYQYRSERDVHEHARDYRKQRKASDI